MEYGILSLVAIALVAAGYCVHNAAQLRGELRTVDLIRIDLVEAKRLALEANERSAKIEVDHYHQLRRQVLDLAEDFKTYKSDFSKLSNQLVSTQGAIGRLKQQFNALGEEKPDEEGGEPVDVPLLPPMVESPKVDNVPLRFGSRRRVA